MTAALPPAVAQLIDATNAEDSESFLAAFAPTARVVDFGRTFAGRDRIAAWSDQENIGTHNRIEVVGFRMVDDRVVMDIEVTGGGYNGTGVFEITLRHGLIETLLIRA